MVGYVIDDRQRLTWLENVFTSPFLAPIKFLNRRFGFGEYQFQMMPNYLPLTRFDRWRCIQPF
jgi:hypothetical protein